MKKFSGKLGAALLALIIAGSAAALPAAAADGGWQRDQAGWWYQNADGGYPKGCWAEIGGKWYHFSAAGYMQTGWLQDGNGWYHLGSSGAMDIGWVNENNKSYYMSSTGRMAQDITVIIDGSRCTFDANGVLTAQSTVSSDEVTSAAILGRINAYRMENGLPALAYAENLQAGVDLRAKECAGEFSGSRTPHTRPDGSIYATAYDWEGASMILENLEMLPAYMESADTAVSMWKSSATHNANMLHKGATGGAVGIWRDPDSEMIYLAFAAERRDD